MAYTKTVMDYPVPRQVVMGQGTPGLPLCHTHRNRPTKGDIAVVLKKRIATLGGGALLLVQMFVDDSGVILEEKDLEGRGVGVVAEIEVKWLEIASQ